MTDAAKLRRARLAQVHILKAELHFDESKYRLELERLTGKRSAKDLTDMELRVVISEWRAMKREADEKPARVTEPQWRHVRWLQRQLKWDADRLNLFCKFCTGIDNVRFLTSSACRHLIMGMRKQYGDARLARIIRGGK